MRKALTLFVTVAMLLVSGCSNNTGSSADNPFIAENAIKGQVGDLYYVVPENAVFDESSTDEDNVYRVSIANSTEEYVLNISYSYVDEEAYESSVHLMEITREAAASASEENAADGASYKDENITEFLGKSVDYGFKSTSKGNGQTMVAVLVITSNTAYGIRYTVKSGFYDQAVWDNFYAQLKFV